MIEAMLRQLSADGAGPMHTDSSAIATCLRLRSTVECTATVRMPRAWHARRMRSAILPRLAITTLSSIARASADHEQRLVELNRLAALALDREHGAGHVGLDRVEHLHRLDDAQRLAGLDCLADADEGRLVWRGRGVIGADHRRAPDVAVGQGRARGGRAAARSEEHTSELPSLMRTSYAVF